MSVPTYTKAAFVGAGIIGSGFAVNCITHGIPAVVQTRSQVDLCRTRIREMLDTLVGKEIISNAAAQEAEKLLSITTSIEEAVTGASIVVESGPENYEVKWSLLAEIERYAPVDAVITSSTSGLLITDIQSKAAHPERVVGGHPYNPAYLIPLVEITKGQKTSDDVAQKAKDFFAAIGKKPVVLNKEVVGFIANRIQMAVYRECVDLVMNGVCSVEDVDTANVFGPGIRWGVIGQVLTVHMGSGPDGIKGAAEKYRDSTGKRLAALADWKVIPENWGTVAQAGVLEEIANRPDWAGKTVEEIAQFRDDMLIELLKLHKQF